MGSEMCIRDRNGIARFVSPTTVDVEFDDGEVEQFSAEKFIIAVGTKPYRPEEIPFDGARIFDSDEILKIKRLPRSLTVIGGGVIGVEYATIFSALDIPITLIEARDTILDFVDKEIIAELMHELRDCLLYTSPSPRDATLSRMPSSA